MSDKTGLNFSKVLIFLAVLALVIAIIFHVLYLVKDRSVLTAQDSYNFANAQMFYLASVAMVIGAGVVGKRGGALLG